MCGSSNGGGERDQLEARGALGERLRRLVEGGEVRCETGFRTARLERAGDGIVVYDEGGRTLGPVDEIVVATGFRPDLSITRELRLRLDDALECPVALAPLIDPNVHSCGTVYPHGFQELSHPEQDFYTVGMKSYGRAPTFLLLTGYEQVRSVVCALTGDLEAARNVELVLPETGVCSTDVGGSTCCDTGEAPGLVGLGAAPAGATVHAITAGVPTAPATAPARGPIPGSCGIASACDSEDARVHAREGDGRATRASAVRGGGGACCG